MSKKHKQARKTVIVADNSTAPKPDQSPRVHQRNKIDYELNIRQRTDLTERQKVILEAALDRDTRCIMIDGIWGTGKSMLATQAALMLLNSGRCKTLLYVRSPVEASIHSRVGFLSGDLAEKMAPYTAVLTEKLEELLPKEDIDRLIKDDRIQCIPTGFLQGRSYNCAAIIVDEAASMSWDDLMLIISRCGPFTRIFFLGDTINQVYLSDKSGFKRFIDAFNDDESKENGVYTFELKEAHDIVRSPFLQFVMRKVGVIKERSSESQEPMFLPKT
jgi:predicted ribonuclease YlaK